MRLSSNLLSEQAEFNVALESNVFKSQVLAMIIS